MVFKMLKLIGKDKVMEKKTIMIVDDEEALVEIIRIKLESEGYNVMVAYDGKEALEKINKQKPNLILLDIMMPELNGFEVCKKLKNNESLKYIPVIMLSAKAQEVDIKKGREVGAIDYITKPFDFAQMIEVIKNHLN